jgi:hypothetical protein
MMNANDEMTAEEWDELTEAEKRRILDAQHEEYVADLSPEGRARLAWEQGS